MDVKPIDFLVAKGAVDYFVQVFDLKLTDEHYKFHIYNMAIQVSLKTEMSESLIKDMADRGDFLKNIESFKDRYWQLMQIANSK